MFGKLTTVMLLVHFLARCESAEWISQFMKVSDAIQMPYVKMSSLSASKLACAALCRDDCLFLKYEDNGSGSGTCDLYNLRDEIYDRLKFVYPLADVLVGIEEQKTWDEARVFCQSLGGSLTIADSAANVERMVDLIGNAIFWVGGKYNGTTWNWLSGAVVTPPPKINGDGTCLELYERKFWDGSCSWKLSSFCEY